MTAPTRAEIQSALKRFIDEELLEAPFAGDDPLAAGEVDSLGIEQLIEYAFEVWNIELDDEDIVAENFESLGSLAALVESKC